MAEEAAERERRSTAAALLAELATSAEEPAPAPEPEPEPEPAALEPVAASIGGSSRDMADTAALLRELSSLGLDDDPPSAPPPAPRMPPRTPAAAPAAQKKKKRGLFGL
jgi:hypothetical protein